MKKSKRWITLSIILFIPIILIILGGVLQTLSFNFDIFGNPVVVRLYYPVSILIIISVMIPFFMNFEKRKPQAREIIVIATLTSIAVAGRVAFFAVPNFKPVCAIVIIAGICFGSETGFLVGALTGFISNFFFGQTAHTPWQMFAFGIVGFLAGVLFKKGLLSKKIIPLAIYGFLSVLIIYGVIVDLSTLFISGVTINKASILTIFASGLAFNIIHAVSTVVFLVLFVPLMMEKLERIKIKYGILEK